MRHEKAMWPIIYVRGYAMTEGEIEATTANQDLHPGALDRHLPLLRRGLAPARLERDPADREVRRGTGHTHPARARSRVRRPRGEDRGVEKSVPLAPKSLDDGIELDIPFEAPGSPGITGRLRLLARPWNN
jgi:hypothetical protein